MLSLNLILIALGVTHALSDDSAPMSPSTQTWYHPSDHPIHDMFKRTPSDSAKNNPRVGSPQWSKMFPPPLQGVTPDPKKLPAKLVKKLNAAVAARTIPNIPRSSFNGNTTVYPNGTNLIEVCSGYYKCRIPGDIWDAPKGIFASSFDDGPTNFTVPLVDFLGLNNQTTTHFMIGINILLYPEYFLTALNAGHDIGVHTWTHPYMTTLSNDDVLSQLFHTMYIIYKSTGFVPKFWRPPYGDTDRRVSAIAKLLNLTTVVWNEDTEDWGLNTTAAIVTSLRQFLTGPKDPGLIVLEHEIKEVTVDGFKDAYGIVEEQGWNFKSLVQALEEDASYSNSYSKASKASNSSTKDVIPKPSVSPVSSNTSSGNRGKSDLGTCPS